MEFEFRLREALALDKDRKELESLSKEVFSAEQAGYKLSRKEEILWELVLLEITTK